MSGLLVGILVARSFSSFVAAQLGWRSVYVISAVLMLALAALLARCLPNHEPPHTARYRDLLASVAQLVRTEPVLRRRAIGQAVMFAVFSSYWTAIAYELVSGHGFSQNGIALFALVGAAGAAVAPASGRLGDRGHGRVASGLAFCLASVAMVLAGVGAGSVIVLGLAGVFVDVAVQSHQLFSLQEIYALRPDARARINTAFMTTVFVGGAIASACTGLVYKLDGWTGVTIFGALLPVLGLAVWFRGRAPAPGRVRVRQSELRSPGGSAAGGASDSPEIPSLKPRIP
jgi:predicted MFS family arabinose efflux permease